MIRKLTWYEKVIMRKIDTEKKQIKNVLHRFCYYFLVVSLLMPSLCLADEDPMTKAGKTFSGILFGTLGTSLCTILIGATFLMAKAGKVSWDRFLFIGFCSAGFLGAPSIVYLIKSMVGS